MNINTQKVQEYAEFLEESSRRIIALCNELEGGLAMATQCMDQQGGRDAAQRMEQSIERIKKNVLISEDARKRLVLTLKYIRQATDIFRR